MPDTPGLTPRDYDPWELATARQFLTLLQRLGVSGSDVARWLRVSRSSVSMWHHGTRTIPPKHLRALRERARLALTQAAELTGKAVALAPSEDVRQAVRAEFEAVYVRWKGEVLAEAGTVRRTLMYNYAMLGSWLVHEPFRADDLESIDLVMGTIRAQVQLLMDIEGVAPEPEEELLARLTQAHAEAAQTRTQRQEEG